jgi:hypothetical protein
MHAGRDPSPLRGEGTNRATYQRHPGQACPGEGRGARDPLGNPFEKKRRAALSLHRHPREGAGPGKLLTERIIIGMRGAQYRSATMAYATTASISRIAAASRADKSG